MYRNVILLSGLCWSSASFFPLNLVCFLQQHKKNQREEKDKKAWLLVENTICYLNITESDCCWNSNKNTFPPPLQILKPTPSHRLESQTLHWSWMNQRHGEFLGFSRPSNNLTTSTFRGHLSLFYHFNHYKCLFLYRLLLLLLLFDRELWLWCPSVSIGGCGRAWQLHEQRRGFTKQDDCVHCHSELLHPLKGCYRQTSTQSLAARCEWPVCSSSSAVGICPTHQEEKRRESAFLKDTFICPLKTGQFV